MNIEQIARIAHEANRAYCQSVDDDSQPSWDFAPDWQKNSAVQGVQFHLAALEKGEKKDPVASHENWLSQKRAEGWTYGRMKDPAKKAHPCFVPYDQLPVEQRTKDYLFSAIVEAFYKSSTVEAAAL